MLRRLVLTSAASLAALVAAAPAAAAGGPLPLPLLAGPDSLTVTVKNSGNPMADGTFELTCGVRSAEGTHPKAKGACDRLEELAQEGRDPFAPVATSQMCTQQHGGDATAHVTGTWQGQDVDAHFQRTNGCEIARWDTLKPLLPMARS
ncbi:SSI family serine proteinase inhibitor [Streptomyces ficellus]|uniref:SSI family serine proteinase inhibitor n=1 Tax=Streptomyces ficellus TaxID=1977088 RepID=A0ABT7ZDD3_9ACTN|nr:SSI family serine proteinase inhibitor [Streptomyces ficellus]MDN3297504.1 SSI family serine proteinase inhibitor [Streptomyces ficellus]